MKSSVTGFNPVYSEDAPTYSQVCSLPGQALLEFGTPWCGHCRAAQPAIEQVLGEHQTLRHIKVLDGPGKPLGRAFGVRRWPTLILLQEGREVARLVRPVKADEVRQLLARSGSVD